MIFSTRELLLLFFLSLLIEDAGFILLSRGMKATRTDSEAGGVARFFRVARHPEVLSGVLLQAVYYGLLLGVLRMLPVSLVVPMTGFGYVLTAWMARIFLSEQIPALRWGGISLIVVGVVLIAGSG